MIPRPPLDGEPDPRPWLNRQIRDVAVAIDNLRAIVRMQAEGRRRGRPKQDPTASQIAAQVIELTHGKMSRKQAEATASVLAKRVLGVEISPETFRKLGWREWKSRGRERERAAIASQSPGEVLARSAELERRAGDLWWIVARTEGGDPVEISLGTRNVDQARALLEARCTAWRTGEVGASS